MIKYHGTLDEREHWKYVKYSMYELYMYIDEEVDILAPTLSTRVTRT